MTPNTLTILASTLADDSVNCLSRGEAEGWGRDGFRCDRTEIRLWFLVGRRRDRVEIVLNLDGTTLAVLYIHPTVDSHDWAEEFDLANPSSLPAIQSRLAEAGVRFKPGVAW